VRALASARKHWAGPPRHRREPQQHGELYAEQDRHEKAEPLYARALAICEKALGRPPNTVTCNSNYAALLRKMGSRGRGGD